MSEEIKDLIEKIQQEGVQAAQDKARKIEEQALGRAREIVEKAKAEALRLIAEAEDKIRQVEGNQKAALSQAGRDFILALKKEIHNLLDKLIAADIRQALSPEETVKIITTLIKDFGGKDKGGIIISLKKDDLSKIEKGLFSQLGEEIKKGIILKPSEDILGGFIISYDSGKSHFDFTDKALAEYIALYLKPQLTEILKNSASSDHKT